MKAQVYTRLLLLPTLVICGYIAGAGWNLGTPVICFIIHPALNLFLKNKECQKFSKSPAFAYRLVEMIYVFVLITLTIWAVSQAASLNGIAFFGFAISIGIINGVLGFTLAHELIHRTGKYERSAGYILLLFNFYMHYGIEHIRGHHVYASTPKDPHTAKRGESFYAFLPNSILRTFNNAVIIEQRRLTRKNYSQLSLHNRIICFLLIQSIVAIAIMCFSGMASLLFFVLQSFIAICLLHAVNYLQHYGLARKESEDKIEKMSGHHAWNSGNRLHGFSLFHLENHAHHHIHPTHSYESLKSMDDSPEYPTGYSGMIVLAMIPPLWFRIVHKRLQLN